jgi:NADH pyrophosphatase NudC (nudix superfamily)
MNETKATNTGYVDIGESIEETVVRDDKKKPVG